MYVQKPTIAPSIWKQINGYLERKRVQVDEARLVDMRETTRCNRDIEERKWALEVKGRKPAIRSEKKFVSFFGFLRKELC